MSAVLEFPQDQYRLMREDDLVQVVNIERAAYQFPWSEGIFRDCLRAGYTCWVQELDQELMGYAVLLTAVDECHILNLCIDPVLQGKGYGRRLLNKMLDYAKGINANSAFLEVRPSNVYAVELYESEGFNEVGIRKDYYPAEFGREDAMIFAKEL